ncbi:MAG: hypothetical protein LBR21_04325 [Propionibacteriaceae bacterium]|jgi:uncharacterized membrane protein YesL|nr:hypothetical protein [Propionibacteriaceae bacterium]
MVATAARRGFAASFMSVTSTVYLLLITDFLMALTCLPVSVLLTMTDLRQSWLALVVVAPLLCASLTSVFAVFDKFADDGWNGIAKNYFRTWGSTAKRTLPIGLGYSVLGMVIGVDWAAFAGTDFGFFARPILAVIAVLAIATFPMVCLLMASGFKGLQSIKVGVPLAVRRWQWTLLNLAVLTVFVSLVFARPALVLLVAPSPVAYIVFGGIKYSLTRKNNE